MIVTAKQLSTSKITPEIKTKPQTLCLCKMFIPIAYLTRLFGFFPLTWEHRNGKCVYKKSYLWCLYSILITLLYIFQLTRSADLAKFKIKSLPILLNNITEAIYGVYIIVLTTINFYRFPRWIKSLNTLNSILIESIFCQSAMKIVLLIQYSFIAMLIFTMVLEASILGFLHFSESYESNFDSGIYINKFLQNVPFVFYMLVFTMISVFIGILGCFEKLTISCLNYKQVHPMKDINETNNVSDFFGVVKYRICKEDHPRTNTLSKLLQPQVIEFLRILHEDISLIIYEINHCLNPQFLCHTVVELTVLIIQWYAVVVYMAFEFKAPMASTIHVVNCLFVVMHSVGIFLFLKNAQHLKNMVQGLNNFLLEYATRITCSEEHQQVRLFIEKLKQHRPLTASGVFTIDLGIAGPISANILTYVLVALQFEIPKEE